MDDLISRQAAIEAICAACNSDDDLICEWSADDCELCEEMVALRELPSV